MGGVEVEEGVEEGGDEWTEVKEGKKGRRRRS